MIGNLIYLLKTKLIAKILAIIVAAGIAVPTGVGIANTVTHNSENMQENVETGILPENEGQASHSKPGNATEPGIVSETNNNPSAYSENTFSGEDVYSDGAEYVSYNSGENALLITDGTSTIVNAKIYKSGDSNGEDADFYGTNAAVLVTGGLLNILNSSVETSGAHANAVFAYGNGVIDISDSTITTSANNSGAIMVTGGGTLTATNVNAVTYGNSSAPIRSDRGGGTMTVNGGEYISNGVGSPAIYSTSNVTVNNASLISNASEGIVIEGSNSVYLNGTSLVDTNNTLNGQSTTYKNIFIYQSMSGDAANGTGIFSANGSNIVTNVGDIFYVTNTSAYIELSSNIFTNNSGGAFLRAEAGPWGTGGSNGADVTLKTSGQNFGGDVVVDNISTLKMALRDSSNYTGVINGANTAKSVDLSLSANSTITLTGNTYVTSFADEDATLSNINFNGYSLYVNGTAVNSSNASSLMETYTETVAVPEQTSSDMMPQMGQGPAGNMGQNGMQENPIGNMGDMQNGSLEGQSGFQPGPPGGQSSGQVGGPPSNQNSFENTAGGPPSMPGR
ncbi:MAG: hypothetical protein K6B15_05680 [Parasporobacterium sp.]|nr:hypothetical protein [Parasporobacterium sp.]